ncbi:hypothetical protein [uncultured Thermanaerothrix sp.]|uniref:hypothetical protein n=1 Tax=uncultured Thermanaerothrix sp. TaxID=1195149 RepID=UPI00262230EB|nr:hypothetical protein [uncultured Thermanaerothrix sp.]
MTETYTLDRPALEPWLWAAACVMRGPIDAAKYRDDLLPREDAPVQLHEAEEERAEADRALWKVLKDWGLGGEHA